MGPHRADGLVYSRRAFEVLKYSGANLGKKEVKLRILRKEGVFLP